MNCKSCHKKMYFNYRHFNLRVFTCSICGSVTFAPDGKSRIDVTEYQGDLPMMLTSLNKGD